MVILLYTSDTKTLINQSPRFIQYVTSD